MNKPTCRAARAAAIAMAASALVTGQAVAQVPPSHIQGPSPQSSRASAPVPPTHVQAADPPTRTDAPAPAQIEACFTPPLRGGCDPLAALVGTIGGARKTIRVQIYTLTSREIVTALVGARRRGVDVRMIVDRRQVAEDRAERTAVGRLEPVLVDRAPGLMHDKVAIIDDAVVVTGSYNYSASAERRNVENLIVIRDPAIAAEYSRNWEARAARSPALGVASPAQPGGIVGRIGG